MEKIFFLLLLALPMMSCKDDFSVSNLPGAKPKLVVYCIPSTSDAIYIMVSRSIPLKQYNMIERNVMIDDVVISYQLNGQTRTMTALDNGHYRAVGQQKAGDKVRLRVRAQGLGTVESLTEIPQLIGIGNVATRVVHMKKDPSASVEDSLQLQATFTGPAQTHDYYAVRVKSKKLRYLYIICLKNMGGYIQEVMSYYSYVDYMEGRRSGSYDSVAVRYDLETAYIPISTTSEPLLSPLSDTNDDFGFSSDFYKQFYVFDDAIVNSRTYTLRLSVEPYTGIKDETKASLVKLKAKYGIEEGLQLELYHIAPVYYRFLQALNDVLGSSLTQAGFSTVRTTYSNMLNGMGTCAGSNMSIKKH